MPLASGTTPPQTAWLSSFYENHWPLASVVKQSVLFMRLEDHRLLPQDWSLTAELDISLWTPLLALLAVRSSLALALVTIASITVFGVHALCFFGQVHQVKI